MRDEIRASIEKVEQLVKLVSGDMSELKRRADGHDNGIAGIAEMVDHLRKDMDNSLRSMANSQAAMASAVSQAVVQLTLAQSLERRVERLESTVFPAKH
ncbi:MAG: hypothetical protein ACYC8T_29855 [Myxococcaceae bacterium]